MPDPTLLARQLEDVMSLAPGSLTPTSPFRDRPEWDSLAVLSTIMMVEEEYGVQIGNSEIERAVTVEDLHNLVIGLT